MNRYDDGEAMSAHTEPLTTPAQMPEPKLSEGFSSQSLTKI